MPKKTKRQKMAAALRRMKKQVEQKAPEKEGLAKPQAKEEVSAPTTYSLRSVKEKEAESPVRSGSREKQRNYAYVAGDLRKIFVLSLVAITFEIALSLTTRLEFAKLLLRRFGIDI
jgi:hypothetical protein